MDATRNLIDYAMDSNGVEFRNELYASIHDRVTAAIEAKKQEIAGSLIRQEAKEEKEEDEEGTAHEKAEKKMMKSLDKNGDGKHTMADHKKEEVEHVAEEDEEKGENAEKKEERPKKPNAFTMKSKGPSEFAKSSSGGKTKETKTGRTHSSGDRY